MSDLISRSELINHLNACLAESDGGTPITDAVIVAIRCAVEQMPAVDAEPMVRCNVCKAYRELDMAVGECCLTSMIVEADEFCSKGERKDNT